MCVSAKEKITYRWFEVWMYFPKPWEWSSRGKKQEKETWLNNKHSSYLQ